MWVKCVFRAIIIISRLLPTHPMPLISLLFSLSLPFSNGQTHFLVSPLKVKVAHLYSHPIGAEREELLLYRRAKSEIGVGRRT